MQLGNGQNLGSVTHLTFSLLFRNRVTIIELKITTASGVKIFKHASSAQSSTIFASVFSGHSFGSKKSLMQVACNKLTINTRSEIYATPDSN